LAGDLFISTPTVAEDIFGWGVIYAVHARTCIERGRVWQAEHYVGAGARPRALARVPPPGAAGGAGSRLRRPVIRDPCSIPRCPRRHGRTRRTSGQRSPAPFSRSCTRVRRRVSRMPTSSRSGSLSSGDHEADRVSMLLGVVACVRPRASRTRPRHAPCASPRPHARCLRVAVVPTSPMMGT
jgi:hypothetical protein